MKNDTTDTKIKKKSTRRGPAGYGKARTEFQVRAQRWMLGRPGRVFTMPDDLRAVTALGVPCETCGALIYRDGDAGHRVSWREDPVHWADGVTATCAT
jgi:hypothetical protein